MPALVLNFINCRKVFFTLLVLSIFMVIGSFTTANASTRQKYDWFWFLYEKNHQSVYPSTMITPFYFSTVEGRWIYTASLPPFIYWSYETESSKSRFMALGFASDTNYVHSNGVRDYDLGVFPFLMKGESQDSRDRYLFVWPIGGTIKGKIGMDYITPWAFPGVALFFLYPPKNVLYLSLYVLASFIPVYVDYGDGDYNAHGIFWPFVQWGSSPTRNDFRILPFYAHNTKKDYYDNYSYLLLINYNRTFFKNEREVDTFMVAPFYARRWDTARITGSSSLLWPFFSWGYNKKMGDLEINFPWPFIIYQRSEKPYIRKKVFFPFYGHVVTARDETEFITPLYFTMKHDTDYYKSSEYITMFIIWYFKRDYKNEASDYYGKSWRYFKIWPLFRYEKNDRGDRHFNLLSILPFRDPVAYEKIYDPVFSLIEYHREGDMRRFGLLLRTYYQCWDERTFRSRIPFIYSYESNDGNIIEFSIIFSMFGYKKKSDGSYLKLFWLPLKVSDETAPEYAFDEQSGEDYPETIPPFTMALNENQVVLGRVRL
jgi:hypothetical protein